VEPWGAALLLGGLEGLTEFIPVSSTGHLLLAGHFLGFESTGRIFEIVIQLGAVLALFTLYAGRLWGLVRAAPRDPAARRFVGAVVLAFLPAALAGVLLHDVIKEVLFETPRLIAVMLILGGVVLILVDRRAVAPRYEAAEGLPVRVALGIGLFSASPSCRACRGRGRPSSAACFWALPPRGGRVLVLPVAAHHGRRRRLRPVGEPRRAIDGRPRPHRPRLRRGLPVGPPRGPLAPGLRLARGFSLFGWWRILVGTVALVFLGS
jgi:undecaprenyl-diphosphatase